MRRFEAGVACALVCLALSAWVEHKALAQTVFGTVAGTVTDTTGAVIAGAQVQAVEEGTGTTLQAVTTSAGDYHLPQVPIGTYDVNVTAPGFQTKKLTGIRVNLQVTTAVNVALEVGTTTQSVTVEASAPQLQTESSDITGSVTDQQYLKLPLALGGVGAFRSPEALPLIVGKRPARASLMSANACR